MIPLRHHRRRSRAPTLVVGLLLAATSPGWSQQTPGAIAEQYRQAADRIITMAMADDSAWGRLADLTDRFGPRLSGSPNLEQAIAWAASQMRRDGLQRVRTEPVRVRAWARGEESLALLAPGPRPLPVLGLGGTVATPDSGLVADALVVSSFADLDRRAAAARGRIVVFNAPFTSYDSTVQYRGYGASRAARHGAVAALVRSVGPVGLRTLHTGVMASDSTLPRIPAAAIAAEDANALQRLQDRGIPIRLRLRLQSQLRPDAWSANLVAELPGRERPEEIVVVGGHLDSWDVGTGATDDGAGCIAAWEALRLLTALDLRPRRTIRLVLWTNEENGLGGGRAYAERYRHELRRHVVLMESDYGVFAPLSYGFTGGGAARALVEAAALLVGKIGVGGVAAEADGVPDVRPAAREGGIPMLSLNGDPERYFTVHHTPADVVERIQPIEMSRAVAALAVMAYVLADLPGGLPR